jgi:hypothetical protein
MPAPAHIDREARTGSGRLLVDCYCTSCDEYSGGGLCRVCQRAVDYGLAAADAQPLPAAESPPVEPDVVPTHRLF